ncbi:MAG: universal stress protein [Halobacteriota archaeon]
MNKRLLVPVDGSPPSFSALEFALEEWPDAEVTVLTVIDPTEAGESRTVIPSDSEEWFQRAKQRAGSLFEEASERAARPLQSMIEVGHPSKTIVRTATEHDFDHVVIGSHGRKGVSRILLGSVAEQVVRQSPVPVTVVR